MSEKIVVEMSREQARAVMDATELLARLEIGQFEEITWKMIEHFRGTDREGKPTFDGTSRDLANAYLKCACMAVFGVRNGWPDVGEKNMQHHRCWAVYATIRHALAWHDHPEGGDTMAFCEPLGYGEKLPVCRVEEKRDGRETDSVQHRDGAGDSGWTKDADAATVQGAAAVWCDKPREDGV